MGDHPQALGIGGVVQNTTGKTLRSPRRKGVAWDQSKLVPRDSSQKLPLRVHAFVFLC